jgi:dihydropyrimidine dehydrogenase (NAD+) subunit PreA
MANLHSNFLGIKSPNPFWLASAPPTDKKINVMRAFEAGWGGVVWKTLGSQVKNVSSRYSALDYKGRKNIGFNNIELISDRPLDINLKEIIEVIKEFPDRAMVVSLMADNDRKSWHELVKKNTRYRRTRHRTQFRLPSRYGRKRHGRRRWSRS